MMPDDRILEEADGLTAGDLRNLVRIHLEATARSDRKG
jgi:chemotaxis protein methyltransferase CheR